MVATIDDGAWRGPYSVTNVQSLAGRNEADGGDVFSMGENAHPHTHRNICPSSSFKMEKTLSWEQWPSVLEAGRLLREGSSTLGLPWRARVCGLVASISRGDGKFARAQWLTRVV